MRDAQRRKPQRVRTAARLPHPASPAITILMGLVVAGSVGCQDPRVAGSSTAPPDSAAGEIGFRWAGPGGAAIVVPVRINGRESVDLILDTGATLTCLDMGLVRELALPQQRSMRGAAVGIGGSGAVQLHEVDSLQIGAATSRRLSICAIDLQGLRAISPDIRGLLGLNVLRSFDVTLDFDREVVRLAPPGG